MHVQDYRVNCDRRAISSDAPGSQGACLSYLTAGDLSFLKHCENTACRDLIYDVSLKKD